MIAEAIDKILSMAYPNYKTTDSGLLYSDKKMFQLGQENRATPLHLSTLSSLIEYIRNFPENKKNMPYLVHVCSHKTVELVSALDTDREREVLARVEAPVMELPFGRYLSNESMLIALQSMFQNDPQSDKEVLLRFAGTVTSGSVKEYGDDGVTQKATIKQGVASKAEAIVPSPCRLRPYRTFIEVEQPMSEFIFRMRDRGDEVESALYEADGGAWRMDAVQNVHRYLQNALEDTGIIIIS